MVRSFSPEPLDPALVERLVADALRSPTAGHTGGTAWVVLEGPDQTATYWTATTDESWHRANPERSAGLRRAPVILLAYSSAEAYLARYAEPDKAPSGLGEGAGRWPVPYWTGDAAFGVMAVLLGAVAAGLGACLLGNFRGEDALARALGVPPEWRLFGSVLVGRPHGAERRSGSLERAGPGNGDRIHRGSWPGEGTCPAREGSDRGI
jgi:nitroreductase